MAKYKSIVITNAGLALVAAAHSGDTIEFTAIKSGNGVYDNTEVLEEMTDLKSVKQTFGVTGITREESTIKVRSVLTNDGVTDGYYITEIGLYALDSATGTEILYAVIVAEDSMADYFPPYSESPQSVTLETYITATGVEDGVTFTASIVEGTYVTVQDFEDFCEYTQNKFKENVTALDDAFANRISNAMQRVEDYIIYVSKNGSDNNDGTEDNPVLTINKAFELASKKYNDVRLFIISSGVYEVDQITFAGNGLHITATAPNVTIKFNREGIFYGTHLNLLGVENGYMTIEVADPSTMRVYCDGGNITSAYVKFDCRLGLNACSGRLVNTIFRHLYIEECHFTFGTGCKFIDKIDDSLSALNSINSTIFVQAPLAFELTKNNAGGGFNIAGGVLNLMAGVTTNSYKYDTTYIRAAILFSYSSVWTTFKTLATNTDCPSNAVLTNLTSL